MQTPNFIIYIFIYLKIKLINFKIIIYYYLIIKLINLLFI